MRERSENELDRRIAARIGAARQLEPPADLRERVLGAMAEAAADGGPSGHAVLRPFAMAAGVAAVAIVAGLLALGPHRSVPDAPGLAPTGSTLVGPARVNAVPAFQTFDFESDSDPATLIAVSGDLERALAGLPASRRLMGVDTASTIAALETQIALIDEQLMLGSAAGLEPEVQQALWWDRVNALNALVQVRYAQSQIFAY